MIQARDDGSLVQDGRVEMMGSAQFEGCFGLQPVGLAGVGLDTRYQRKRRVKDAPEDELQGLELPLISQLIVKTAGEMLVGGAGREGQRLTAHFWLC